MALIKAYKKEGKFREWFVLLTPLLSKKTLKEEQIKPLFMGLDTKVATSE